MKKWISIALAISALVLPATAFAGKDHKFIRWGTGTVVVDEKGNQASITIAPHQYGGVYAPKAPASSKLAKLVFQFKSDGDVQGGAPRWSIPIDTDGNRNTTESWAFLDAANCGAAVGNNEQNMVTLVSTESANCKVFLNTGGEWDNWASFAAQPGFKLSKDIPFIISDVAGDYHVSDLRFG